MENFNALSLGSTAQNDNTLEESDLLAMSTLSISERKQPTRNELISKFQPYNPQCPSPLRATVIIPENDFVEDMEIDEVYDVSDVEDETSEAQTNTQNKVIKKTVSEDVLDDSILSAEIDDTASNCKDEQTRLIKAILSPTSLGIALATRDLDTKQEPQVEDPSLDNPSSNLEPISSNINRNVSSSSTSTSIHDLPFPSEENVQSRASNTTKPWRIQVQNHHHYYMLPNGPNRDSLYHETQPEYLEPLDQKALPVPWSSKSNPASKASYAFTSYLQLALNTITVMIICSTITAFAKAVRTDIKSTWDHKKLELDFESANCKVEYLANHCNQDEVVPALVDQCNQWGKCMSRNNDIYFRARTSLGARLFGEIINSLIEPLGWKALVVILVTLIIWCFSSNFLLGFMRAKSYYGTSAPQAQLPPSTEPSQAARPTDDEKSKKELSPNASQKLGITASSFN
ncbi:unnamed protein product [Kluyveromyces dobzhanskii CBS 2104]|uniref:WGS project CCBQ000000000 data, contig 00099 n=1 Tax=Kluyveromyces dobzhanskii CBS 2104 TaxID=1427455 RepID=A0A0A8L2C5_9SACH|nr:unnamed protein product [Kluyveromyces dobzhanskii CBS 2104]